MSLNTTPVSRCLDKKIFMFGFEALDVLLIFLVLSVLNLLFGQSGMKFISIWVPTALLAAVLRFGKRDKPEHFLMHFVRYQFKPGIFSAFSEPTSWAPISKFKGGAEQ